MNSGFTRFPTIDPLATIKRFDRIEQLWEVYQLISHECRTVYGLLQITPDLLVLSY